MEQTKLTGYPSIDKPWLKYYSEEAINAPLPECTIYEYLWENNKDHPDDIAIIYFNRKITYGELFQEIDNTAAALLGIGIKKGEIVTVAMPSIPEALYAVYALNKIGAVANMIHPLAGEQELCNYLNEVESKVFLMFTGTYEIIKNVLKNTSVKTSVVVSPAQSLSPIYKCLYRIKTKETKIKNGSALLDWSAFLEKGRGVTAEKVEKNCHEMALISHTGGTTGEPKGCMISNYNINAEIWQVGKTMYPVRQECMMAVLPPFINYGLTNGMFEPLAFGMKLVLIPKYDPMKFAAYVSEYQVNHINTIPAYCESLLRIPRIDKQNLSSIKNIVYGGEGMNDELEQSINQVLKKCGCKYELKKGLGMTEATSAASATVEGMNHTKSAGIPFPKMVITTVDPITGKEIKYGTEGEICISGPTIMAGYFKKEQDTADIIKEHSDGQRWLHTGDLGYIREDGVIYVTGRIKRIIMTKGNDGNITKIFPDRIEKVLLQHPAIDLCCVIGVKHDVRIHYPKAFVVLTDGFSDSETLTEEIKSFCKDKLPGYMIPDEIEYLPDLPRTSRGKIDYRALEERAAKDA